MFFFHKPLVLRFIIFSAADEPEVGLHRLLAVRQVALCEEVNLVLGDLGQVLFTRRYHRTYGLETLTSSHLFRFERRRTLHFLSQPSSIFAQLCCPFFPGLLSAPDTWSIPALHSTFAIILKNFVKVSNKIWGSPTGDSVVHPVGRAELPRVPLTTTRSLVRVLRGMPATFRFNG